MARINWNTNQPIIHHLRDVLPDVFPVLTTPGHGQSPTGIGGYVHRTIRGSTRMSDHAEGRAADIYLDAFDAGERRLGDALYKMFVNNANDLGVDYVIWNMRIWSQEKPTMRLFTKKPHHDHVHVSFTRAGSQLKPVRLRALAEDVKMGLVQQLRSEVATGVRTKSKMTEDMLLLLRNRTAVGEE